MELKNFIRDIKDYPKEGIVFKDITPLLADSNAFNFAINQIASEVIKYKPKYIISPEARGFIFGTAVAYKVGCGFIPVRKKGKLPAKVIGIEYDLEYGTETLEIHSDTIKENDSLVFVDDVLATGGTLDASIKLCNKLKAKILNASFLLELDFLNGREKFSQLEINSILNY